MLRSAQGVVVDVAELTDPGRDPQKQINEDSLALAETEFGIVAVVCDGMGGHASGELASRTALARILEVLQTRGQPLERLLAAALERAHAEVYALGADTAIDVRPGSTAVLLALAGREALVAHVGDSRAYRVRARRPERLTRDHSVVEALLAAHAITPEQANSHPDANRITRALGIAPDVEPELSAPLHVEIGDAFLLCSDGLSDLLSDEEIAEGVSAATSPEAACQALVALANERGGHDNISVLVLRVLAVGLPRKDGNTAPVAGDGNTIVQTPQFTLVMGAETPPTVVGFDSDPVRRTAPTLVDPGVAQGIAARESAAKTIPTAHPAAPPLTPVSPARGPLAPAGAERPSRPSFPFRQHHHGWLLFWAAVAICGLILAAITLWWLLGR